MENTVTDLMRWADIADIIAGLGITGLLFGILVMFYKGNIVSRPMVDEIKAHGEAQTKLFAAEISDAIVEGMRPAVKESIIAAVRELNGGGD